MAMAQAKPDGKAASIVIDMNSGEILYARSADSPRYPASLTKMMTLYVLFAYMRAGKIAPDSELVVTPYAASQAPTKLGLKPGQTIKTVDAVKALVTKSANDAAAVIAENIAGTEANFARIMTEQARALGMHNTTFRNASGLPDPEQISTARDLAILSQRLIRDFPEYYPVFATKQFAYRGQAFRNHNRMLFDYAGTDGIKTGYIRASGFNLALSVRRDNKHLVAVVMGGTTAARRNATMRALLDKHWAKAKPLPPSAAPGPLLAAAPGASSSPGKKPSFVLAGATSVAGPAALRPGADLLVPAAAGSEQTAAGSKPVDGAYHVQVGAFASKQEAENRLGEIQGKAKDILNGHQPLTTKFQKGDRTFFRARFASFSEDAGKKLCGQLKSRSIDCIVMRAE